MGSNLRLAGPAKVSGGHRSELSVQETFSSGPVVRTNPKLIYLLPSWRSTSIIC